MDQLILDLEIKLQRLQEKVALVKAELAKYKPAPVKKPIVRRRKRGPNKKKPVAKAAVCESTDS